MPDFKLVVWEKGYLVGIASIDEQHRGLVDPTNDLLNGCWTNEAEAVYPDLPAYRKLHEELVRILGLILFVDHGYEDSLAAHGYP